MEDFLFSYWAGIITGAFSVGLTWFVLWFRNRNDNVACPKLHEESKDREVSEAVHKLLRKGRRTMHD